LDSQFRCGKCARPISSKFTKCLECGYLGPHTFNTSAGAAIEGGPPAARPPKRRDTYPADQIDRPSPNVTRPPERFEAMEPADVAEERPRAHATHEIDDDNKFPVGMRPRSPILDYVEHVDGIESTDERRRPGRESEDDSDDRSEERERFSSTDEGEERVKPAPGKPNNTLTLIISIILILLLAIAAIYVINNYEELTKWLASPTVPEVFKPSE
jgi:hypothetical protein